MIGRGARRFVGWAKARNAPCPRVSQNAFLKPLSQNRVGFAALNPPYETHERQRKQNADRRGSPCFTFRRSAHPGQGALACRRSTAALARETAGPQGSASGHAFRDGPERSVLYGRSNRGAETLRFAMHDPEKWMPVFRQDHAPLAGVTRAETSPSAVSTSHAGHCAGRLMPDAARVQRGRTLCPRAPDPLPPALRHPAGVLARGARQIGFYSLSRDFVKNSRIDRDNALNPH